MGGECKGVARRREGNAVHPAGCTVQVLTADGVERQTLSPSRGLRTGIVALDEGTEDASVAIGAAGGEQHAVGVPGDAGDSGAERLLQVLGHPPVVLFFKVADGDNTGTRADGKLALVRAPADAGCCTVDTEEDESWLPLAGLTGLPDVGIAVLRAGHDTAAVRGDIDTGDELIVAAELILEAELVALLGVELDIVGAGDGEGVAVGGEGVVGNGRMEQVVHFGRGHVGLESKLVDLGWLQYLGKTVTSK